MIRNIAFIHTVAMLVDRFRPRFQQELPATRCFHMLDESVLQDLLREGPSPSITRRVVALATLAADAGADELDVVPDFGALADRDSRLLLDDLAAISSLGLPVKVIVESGRLEAEALELLVEVSLDAGVRFLKSGSGFGPPVTVAQVQRLRQLARGRAGIKASGGINSLEMALELVEAGATRLGTSRGILLMQALRQPAAPSDAPTTLT
jgi:deoxyribose-phosphate aldolase